MFHAMKSIYYSYYINSRLLGLFTGNCWKVDKPGNVATPLPYQHQWRVLLHVGNFSDHAINSSVNCQLRQIEVSNTYHVTCNIIRICVGADEEFCTS